MGAGGSGHTAARRRGLQPGHDGSGRHALYPVATAVTHVDGMPADCMLLTEMWTEAIKNDGSYDEANSGIWVQESKANPSPNPDNEFAGGEVMTATEANSGGLFGGAFGQ